MNSTMFYPKIVVMLWFGSAGAARHVFAVHTTAAFIRFFLSDFVAVDMRTWGVLTVPGNVAPGWSWRLVPSQTFGQAGRWGRAKSSPKTIQKKIIYRKRAAAMLPGWWDAQGLQGAILVMSPALGDTGLRKILPTGIRIVGMDLTIPGKSCLCYSPYLI